MLQFIDRRWFFHSLSGEKNGRDEVATQVSTCEISHRLDGRIAADPIPASAANRARS
jgi:hypothetical protein